MFPGDQNIRSKYDELLTKKKNMRVNKNGSVLIMAIIFVIVAIITSIGLYGSAYYAFKTHGMDDVKRARGYYAALGGIRYATILLKKGTTTSPISIKTQNPQLWNQLGLSGSEDINFTMTQVVGSTTKYDITSKFQANSVDLVTLNTTVNKDESNFRIASGSVDGDGVIYPVDQGFGLPPSAWINYGMVFTVNDTAYHDISTGYKFTIEEILTGPDTIEIKAYYGSSSTTTVKWMALQVVRDKL